MKYYLFAIILLNTFAKVGLAQYTPLDISSVFIQPSLSVFIPTLVGETSSNYVQVYVTNGTSKVYYSFDVSLTGDSSFSTQNPIYVYYVDSKFEATFSPRTEGELKAKIKITYDHDPKIFTTSELWGYGYKKHDSTYAFVDKDSLDFGVAPIGSFNLRDLFIINPDTSANYIVSLPTGKFSIGQHDQYSAFGVNVSAPYPVVYPNNSLHCQISFRPQSYGTFRDTIRFYTSAIKPYDTLSVIVFGTCVQNKITGGQVNERLSVFPNPSREFSVFSVYLSNTSVINLSIFDLLGNSVKTIVDEKRDKGEYTQTINISDLPNGVYTVLLRTNDELMTTKLVVNR